MVNIKFVFPVVFFVIGVFFVVFNSSPNIVGFVTDKPECKYADYDLAWKTTELSCDSNMCNVTCTLEILTNKSGEFVLDGYIVKQGGYQFVREVKTNVSSGISVASWNYSLQNGTFKGCSWRDMIPPCVK